MIKWIVGDSSKEDFDEEKAPDTVRDPDPCPTCSYYEKHPTPCLGSDESTAQNHGK